MKTLNFSLYEKLKIRSVDVHGLTYELGEPIPADQISMSDLKPGYICKTNEKYNEFKSNIILYVDYDTVKKLFPSYPYHCDSFIHPRPYAVSKLYAASYICIDFYDKSWPKYNMCSESELNIKYVWRAPETPVLNSIDDLFDFYDKYNLFDLCE